MSISLKDELSVLKLGDHASLIFRNREDQMAVTIPFILIGLERKEQCFYLGDPLTLEYVKENLKKSGVNIEKELDRGALNLVSNRDYHKDGTFHPETMIAFLSDAVQKTIKDGYAGFRATGDVIWELGTDLDLKKLYRYEGMLDAFFEGKKILGLCQYRSSLVPPQFIRHSLYTHPLVIYGQKICRKNDFYDPLHSFQEFDSEKSEYHAVSQMCEQLLAAN